MGSTAKYWSGTENYRPATADDVACPKCHAPAHQVCLQPNGRELPNGRTQHAERVRHHQRTRATVPGLYRMNHDHHTLPLEEGDQFLATVNPDRPGELIVVSINSDGTHRGGKLFASAAAFIAYSVQNA